MIKQIDNPFEINENSMFHPSKVPDQNNGSSSFGGFMNNQGQTQSSASGFFSNNFPNANGSSFFNR